MGRCPAWMDEWQIPCAETIERAKNYVVSTEGRLLRAASVSDKRPGTGSQHGERSTRLAVSVCSNRCTAAFRRFSATSARNRAGSICGRRFLTARMLFPQQPMGLPLALRERELMPDIPVRAKTSWTSGVTPRASPPSRARSPQRPPTRELRAGSAVRRTPRSQSPCSLCSA